MRKTAFAAIGKTGEGRQAGHPMPPGMDKAKVTQSHYDWDKPVTIEAPPADQIDD